jgi:hypothetical protein
MHDIVVVLVINITVVSADKVLVQALKYSSAQVLKYSSLAPALKYVSTPALKYSSAVVL